MAHYTRTVTTLILFKEHRHETILPTMLTRPSKVCIYVLQFLIIYVLSIHVNTSYFVVTIKSFNFVSN
jgi:hypothetical protein